jgi:hypothetical protein
LSCAVIVLAVALLLAEKLGVIADGLLLGGIFTLLYGIGRGMDTDSNKYRFMVATVGLVVTLVLGYIKFTRHQLKEAAADRMSAGNVLVKVLVWLLALGVIGGSVYGTYAWQHSKVDKLDQQVVQLNDRLHSSNKPTAVPAVVNEYVSKKGVTIKVYTPLKSSTLTSPVIVMGEVPGNWSFEASFPIKLLDAKGNVIAQEPAQLLGDWMTDKLVPFTAKLSYSDVASGSGTLLLTKDNPSGIAANEDSLSIPVKF